MASLVGCEKKRDEKEQVDDDEWLLLEGMSIELARTLDERREELAVVHEDNGRGRQEQKR